MKLTSSRLTPGGVCWRRLGSEDWCVTQPSTAEGLAADHLIRWKTASVRVLASKDPRNQQVQSGDDQAGAEEVEQGAGEYHLPQ